MGTAVAEVVTGGGGRVTVRWAMTGVGTASGPLREISLTARVLPDTTVAVPARRTSWRFADWRAHSKIPPMARIQTMIFLITPFAVGSSILTITVGCSSSSSISTDIAAISGSNRFRRYS
ncbi:hypothetical protein GCM10020220_057540 [Nonomuraea rubra]